MALNRAVAIGEAHGPERGLELLDQLERDESLAGYHLLPAARAEFLHRLGRASAARAAFDAALALVGTEPERRFLVRRRAEVPRLVRARRATTRRD